MILLFVNGNKGLAANYNGKFYFPDKNSRIIEPGVYACMVSIEKDNYAFVTGDLLATKAPSVAYANSKFTDNFLANKMSNSQRIDEFHVKRMGRSTLMISLCRDTVIIDCLFHDGTEMNLCKYEINYRKDYNMAKLYDIDKFESIVTYEGPSTRLEAALLCAEKLPNKSECMPFLVSLLSFYYSELFTSYSNLKNLTVFDNKIVVVTSHLTSLNCDSKITYVFNKKYGFINIGEIPNINTYDKTATIDAADIENWMIKNHTGFASSDDIVCNKNIKFMGTNITVQYVNAKYAMHNIDATYLETVTKSFDELDAFRKQLGKNISKNMLSELSKLSPKNILCKS